MGGTRNGVLVAPVRDAGKHIRGGQMAILRNYDTPEYNYSGIWLFEWSQSEDSVRQIEWRCLFQFSADFKAVRNRNFWVYIEEFWRVQGQVNHCHSMPAPMPEKTQVDKHIGAVSAAW